MSDVQEVLGLGDPMSDVQGVLRPGDPMSDVQGVLGPSSEYTFLSNKSMILIWENNSMLPNSKTLSFNFKVNTGMLKQTCMSRRRSDPIYRSYPSSLEKNIKINPVICSWPLLYPPHVKSYLNRFSGVRQRAFDI